VDANRSADPDQWRPRFDTLGAYRDEWLRQAAATAAPGALTPVYLQGGGLSFVRAPGGEDSYVADPAKPVPFEPLPVKMGDHATWSIWLVHDQRSCPRGRTC
jgi:hypothetical protein